MSASVMEVGESNFDGIVGQSAEPVLIDFWGAHCKPCERLAPVLEELAGEFSGRVRFAKMDVWSNENLCAGLGIRGVPTLMIFKGGKMVDRRTGAPTKDILREWIDEHLG